MPIEWVAMTDVAKELNMNYRTFKDNYMGDYPPERVSGNRRWWKRSTVEHIKSHEFNIETENEHG